MVPFYLLGEESNEYPFYVDNSDIPMSLLGAGEDAQSATTIEKITVSLSPDQFPRNFQFELENISLLTSADQLIEICMNKIAKQNRLGEETRIGGIPWYKLKRTAMKEGYKDSK